MFKRLFWLSTGTAIGVGSSFWVQRAIRQRISQYAPDRIADNVATAARGAKEDLRAALTEGRDAMRRRESELRAELETPL
jgi:CO dehydrogenase/acetyl-CoA synthase beta subunit